MLAACLVASGCRHDDSAATNIAAQPGAGPLPQSVVAQGRFDWSTGLQTNGIPGAIQQLLGANPTTVAELWVPYSLEAGLAGACLAQSDDACLTGFAYATSSAPTLLQNLVDFSFAPAPIQDGILGDWLYPAGASAIGISVPVGLLQNFVGAGQYASFSIRYDGKFVVAPRDRIVPDDDGLAIMLGEDCAFDPFPGCGSVPLQALRFTHVGLFGKFDLVPEAPMMASFGCECSGGVGTASHPFLQDMCDRLASELCGCDWDWDVKINRLPAELGLSLGGYNWTTQEQFSSEPEHYFAMSNAFPGSRAYPSLDLFGVQPIVSSIPTVRVTFDPVTFLTETQKDVVVRTSMSCNEDTEYWCNVLANGSGWNGCEDMIVDFSELYVQGTFGAGVTHALEAELAPVFTFDDDLPPPCDFPSSAAPNPCSEGALRAFVAASFTSQKHDWFYSPFVGYKGGGYLPITDITFAAAPDNQATVSFFFDNDPDGDSIPTGVDNCPFVPNELQWDQDGDGIGDVCDHCAFDTENDLDGDGVCGNLDNCPLVANADQRNCNEHSEERFNAVKLGDACDPVPCPDVVVEAQYDEITIVCPPHCTPGVGGCHPSCPADPAVEVTLTCVDLSRVDLGLRPLMSYPSSLMLPPQPVPGVTTPARGCVEQLDQFISCNTDQDLSGSGMFHESDHWSADTLSPVWPWFVPEQPQHHYHRLTFLSGGEGNGLDPNDLAATVDYTQAHDEAEPASTWRWNVRADHDRWMNGTTPPLLTGEGTASASDMRVSVWTHAATGVGQVTNSGTGIHDADVHQLNNHYSLYGVDDEPYPLHRGDQNGCLSCAVPLDIPSPVDGGSGGSGSSGGFQGSGGEPGAASQLPPYLVLQPLLDPPADAPRRYGASELESRHLLRLPDGQIGSLNPSSSTCQAEVTTSRAGAELLGRLWDPDVVLVRAAEPYSHLGSEGSTFPLAVMLNAEGGEQILDSVTTDGKSVLATGDREACSIDTYECADCPSRRCGLFDKACCDLPCTSGADCPTGYCDMELGGICGYPLRVGSPHVRGYQAVLSRVAGGVFVAGGIDVDTGEPSGEIWFSRLAEDDWHAVHVPVALGEVLAITYSFATRELFVLDRAEGADGDPGLVRLAALNPETHAFRKLGSFSHHPAWDRHWLVIDRDGGLLLVSSRSTARIETHLPKEKPGKTLLCHFPPDDLSAAHTIAASGQGTAAHLAHGDTPGACAGWALARFDIRGGAATLDGIRTGPEPLWLPPLADAGGYTFVHLDQAGGILRRRSYALDLEPASAEELGWHL